MIVSEKIQTEVLWQTAEYQKSSGSSMRMPPSLFLDETRFKIQLDELRDRVGDLRGRRILEVGSGYGLLLAYSRLREGLDHHGLEPSRAQGGRFETARELLLDNGLDEAVLTRAGAEKMPFEDACFDLVFSFQVLEHVQDPAAVLAESWRVLKPGGILYINAPNYRSFYEGHYHIPWIPGMPKSLAKVYARIWGRNPTLVDELNFIDEPWMKKTLRRVTGQDVQSDFGLVDWCSRMRSPRFSEYTDPKVIRLVRMAQKLGLLGVLALAGKWIRSQDVIRVAVTKPLR